MMSAEQHKQLADLSLPQPYGPTAGRSVAGILRAGADRHPDRELLVCEGHDGVVSSYSWQECLDHARGVASRLEAAGVGRGDRVHLHLRNRPEFLFSWFGAALMGASIVPTNILSSVDELEYIVRHSEVGLSLTEDSELAAVSQALEQARVKIEVLCCERDELLEASGPPVPSEEEISPAEELAILFTSGTTSRPKGVIVNQANYVFAGEVFAKGLGVTPEDRLVATLPLFHANAQYYSTMGALTVGATLIVLPRFSASRFIEQCIAHRATVANLFAAPVRMILAQNPKPAWRDHQLRVVLFAQNLSDSDLQRWDREIGAPLLQMYGMTETIGPPLINPIWGERRPMSIGQVSVGYWCKVIRVDGQEAGVGETGELFVAGVPGVSLTSGYLSDPEATAQLLSEGWLRTGDLVSVDSDGYFSFVDRDRDMIKRGGENVAASEVEAILTSHPAVMDAAAVGVPDPMLDEAIVAFVVVRPSQTTTPDELMAWCGERLAKFRVPSEIILREALPRTSVGKVQKHLLANEHLSPTNDKKGKTHG
jgi:crotonobetaine/carnitine-CoA ligase